MSACHVVDQIGQRLRHRGAGAGGEQLVQFVGGLSGVHGPAHGRLAHPVHRGVARRLDVGDGLDALLQVRLQRSGGHHGQVGLHEDVVHRLRQRVGHRGRRAVLVVVEQGPCRRGECAEADHAQCRGLGHRLPHALVAQPAALAGRAPRQDGDQLVHTLHPGPGGQVGEGAEHPTAGRGCRRTPRLLGQRGDHLVLRVLRAHQPRHARQVEPGLREDQPAAGLRGGQPRVRQRRGHPPGRGVLADGDQPGAHGQFGLQGGGALVDVEVPGEAAQFPHPEPAGLEHR